ncbi:galactose-binding domain-containing protein [Cryptosporangium minutisporangium]|uniref:galactose-binding domain-containing protein n=1 Tax=Cryptosporangium minutisporangium TaxID=113569 RepID=UPI0031E94B13
MSPGGTPIHGGGHRRGRDGARKLPDERPLWQRPKLISLAAVILVVVLAAGDSNVRPPLHLLSGSADGTVTVALNETINEFQPHKQLGAGVDGLEGGEIAKVWTQKNITAMKSAGWGAISYRLRTELGVKAWHWNPVGTWSNPAKKEGYWTSSDVIEKDAGVSYGYHLPRRGNTIDQANNDAFAKITDGDPTSFWKSNPYLDPHFTKRPSTEHQQWIMIGLGYEKPVQDITINWGDPYASKFKVQYWSGSNDAIHPAHPTANWKDFPNAAHDGTGGKQTVTVADSPVSTQFVRILMSEGSGTGPAGSTDIRDRLGYSVRELSIGYTKDGSFVDHLVHRKDQEQSPTWVSSTDPWHKATDMDKDYEHASFERTYGSGLTNNEPMMIPVPVLYGIPDDAAALVSYLKKKKFPFFQVEMGEEPDGQLATPEDYAQLYMQVADAIKKVDPNVQMGGPGYQTVIPDWIHWRDANGDNSWTSRFVKYLKAKGRMEDFDFFSFEWYPFDDVCGKHDKQIAEHPKLFYEQIEKQYKNGLPRDVPMVITEYGYSSFAGQVELEFPGAIVNVETAAMHLEVGGHTSYFYGLEPNWVFQEEEGKPCNTFGNLMMLQFYEDFKIRPLVGYYAAQLVTRHWVKPGNEKHQMLKAKSDLKLADGNPQVTSWAVRRPDGKISILLINKDPKKEVSVKLEGSGGDLSGPYHMYQYSQDHYDWKPGSVEESGGKPTKSFPPTKTHQSSSKVTLPPYSISVVHAES